MAIQAAMDMLLSCTQCHENGHLGCSSSERLRAELLLDGSTSWMVSRSSELCAGSTDSTVCEKWFCRGVVKFWASMGLSWSVTATFTGKSSSGTATVLATPGVACSEFLTYACKLLPSCHS